MNYSTRVKPGDYVASVAAVNAFGVGEPSVINVSLPLYSVNFTASGIPLGARWGGCTSRGGPLIWARLT